jgi:hypothetical protein
MVLEFLLSARAISSKESTGLSGMLLNLMVGSLGHAASLLQGNTDISQAIRWNQTAATEHRTTGDSSLIKEVRDMPGPHTDAQLGLQGLSCFRN